MSFVKFKNILALWLISYKWNFLIIYQRFGELSTDEISFILQQILSLVV